MNAHTAPRRRRGRPLAPLLLAPLLLLAAPARGAGPATDPWAAAPPLAAPSASSPMPPLTPPRAAEAAPAHGGPVRALALSADGAWLLAGGFDGRVSLHPAGEAGAGAGTARALRFDGGAVSALAALPGGGWAVAGEDGRVALWPAPPDGAPTRWLAGHEAPVLALAAGDGRLLSGARDGTARLWDLGAGTARRLRGHDGPVTAVAFGADGAPLTAGADGTLRAWPEAVAGADGGESRLLFGPGLPLQALLSLPDGALVLGGADGALRLLPGDGGPARLLEQGGRPILALAALPGNAPGEALLLSAPLGGAVQLWSLPSGRLLRSLDGPAGVPVWSLALRPGRAWTGGADGAVRGWDLGSGRALDAGEPAAAAAVPAGADPRGAEVFRACGACHALAAGDRRALSGPSLHGLFGRRMGTVPGYPYSERLARGDITWTPASVAELFTRGPAAVTPGTRMPEQRLSDPDDMAALLRFLAVATR